MKLEHIVSIISSCDILGCLVKSYSDMQNYSKATDHKRLPEHLPASNPWSRAWGAYAAKMMRIEIVQREWGGSLLP